MKKIIFFLLIFIAQFVYDTAYAAIGDWKTFLAYYGITNIVPAGENVYVLSSKNLYSYNAYDQSITEYNKVKDISDTEISHIAYCKSAKRLIVVYTDYNIDLIDDNGYVTNISDFYSKVMTDDKTINNVDVYGKYAYLSTNFGAIKLNVADAEITETYKLGVPITSMAEYNNKIYASVHKQKILVANTNDNLIDKSNWKEIPSYAPQQFCVFDNQLGGIFEEQLWLYDENTCQLITNKNRIFENYYSFNDNCLILGNSNTGEIEVFNGSFKNDSIFKANGATYVVYDKTNKCYWQNKNDGCLSAAKSYNGQLETIISNIKPEAPKYNYFGYMKMHNGKLYTCGGGYDTGGAELVREGTIQVLNEDGTWQIFQDCLDTIVGHDYLDTKALDIDPTNPARVISSGRTGIYEFSDGKFVKHYSEDQSTPLKSAIPGNMNYVIVQALSFDQMGNLWCFNSLAPKTNLLELTAEKTWNNHYFAELCDGDNSLANVVSMISDSRGNLWFCNKHWNVPSVYCYNIVTNQLKSYKTFINQNNTKIELIYVNCIAEDKNGDMWIGTNAGPLLLKQSEFESSNPVFEQVIVPRNDGSGLGDYLLNGVNISGIAIDGANRKWFATSANGVFEISADNITQLNNFTVENSPLLADNIESIAYNGTTGEIFLGTGKGLCSYVCDATEPSPGLEKDKIRAYPNPVEPDYHGLITIAGLTSNSQIKICSPTGYVVSEGRSNGGTFTWNGCDKDGKRVASGVYLVLTTNSDGSKGAVCKIAMIK